MVSSNRSGKLRGLACAALTMLFAACSATTIEGTWLRPGGLTEPILGPVMVVGVMRDETVRRVYEDEMAALLAARGLQVQCSYEVLPGALGPDATDQLLAKARAVSARYVLSTALISKDIEHVVSEEPTAYSRGYRGWYGPYYGSTRVEVRSIDVYNAGTSLLDVEADRIEWTARTRTEAPSDIQEEMRSYADLIVQAMTKDGLLGPVRNR